jgi:hypothetical protein
VRPAPEDELVTGSAQGPAAVPPGWPAVVRPPGAPHWERTALNWLLDLCPADYRGYPVLARHPALLAWLAGHHLDGQLQATRRALATVRADLADVVPPPVLTEALDVVESEEARILAARRGVALVGQALRGVRFVPRL